MTRDSGQIADAVPSAADEEVYVFPASYAQQRMWFLDQFEPGSAFYNIPTALRLEGRLDAESLERAINEVVRRHEALRTTFAAVDGRPVQVVVPDLCLPLRRVDLAGRDDADREAARLTEEEARRPFDLANGPLLRATLVRLDAGRHLLLVTMHHIVSDGWSIGVFVNETAVLYEAFRLGRPSPLPELPIQYPDFAEWQQNWLRGEVLERQVAYWRDVLAEPPPPVLELPTDRPRPAVQTYGGASTSRRIRRPLTDAINELSRREGVTPFMTLLAALQVLLSRYTGQLDFCVGTPVANRTRHEVEGLIGVFINTLVLRADLSGELSFRDLLRRVRDVALGAYDHQDVPFEMLVDALQPERDMSHSTLFQVMFILQNAPGRAVDLPGLRLAPVETDTGSSTYDLTLSMAEEVEGYDASVEYNTDLFDRPTVDRFLEHFDTLLAAAVGAPDVRITELPVITERERHRQLEEWNRTERTFPESGMTVVELFEARVDADPEAVAVVTPAGSPGGVEERVTYAELDARANRLADLLRSRGARREVPIAILLEKSCDLIAATLAVLKSGAAFVPLDPTYPTERIRSVLAGSGTPLLVTRSEIAVGLDAPCDVLHLDAAGDDLRARPETRPGVASGPDDLAYLIYTSGSTGTPKGVMVEQGSLVNAFLAWKESYELQPREAHLQMASFGFDVFCGDFVRALCSGGTLVLCPRDLLLSPDSLHALIERESVRVAEFVPAVLRALVDQLEEVGRDLSSMRLVACGSDAWYVSEYERFRRACGPDTRLINSFGLTEATIDSCWFEADRMDLPADRLVPIGRPFANNRLYVLDACLQPVPVGVKGELFVGGLGVARGYHGDPDLTARRFLPDPFARTPGARMYRTGDAARYLPDGNIEFLGRLDFQVKIRGFRIEVGEVEGRLLEHSAVRQAVVSASEVTREDGTPTGARALVAYLVAEIAADRVPWVTRCLAWRDGDDDRGTVAAPVEMATVDLSCGGVRLERAPAEWSPGDRVRLSFALPDEDERTFEGLVAWSAGTRVGVRFDLSLERKPELLRAVHHIATTTELEFADLRHAAPRVPVRVPATVEIEGERFEVGLENLSPIGFGLERKTGSWKNGQRVRVRFDPSVEAGDGVEGTVAWNADGRAGIVLDPDEADLDWLDAWLRATLEERGFTLTELRGFLLERLPDYMVPSAFVLLDSLPLSANGKIDRGALPAPDFARRDWGEEYVAPRTEVEREIARIWQELLDVERVGARDDFFVLGGHSLLATQLASRIRGTFSIEIPLRNVFEYSTVASLAERVEMLRIGGAGPAIPPITRVAREGPAPLSFGQQRLWFLDQLEPGSASYNIPEAVRLRGSLDPALFEQALNEVVRRHESLRTRFLSRDGLPTQEILAELHVPVPLVDLRSLPPQEREAEAKRIARREMETPFDLSSGPLLRCVLVRLEEREFVILLTLHHIAGDDWSTGVLIGELTTAYEALVEGRTPQLPELPVQYVDYAIWQREWLQGDVLDRQLHYWTTKLAGMPPLLELPTDRPRPAIQTFAGSGYPFSFPAGLSRRLRRLSVDTGATPFMVFLAALQALLHRYTDDDVIPIGTPIANRGRQETEGLIGFFVNTLVMRGDLAGDPSFEELLARVRATALEAFAHQDVPFEMVVEALDPERVLSHSPLFQVMFALQSTPQRERRSRPDSNLALEPFQQLPTTAKFDLTLFMAEDGDAFGGAWEYNTDLFDEDTIRRLTACMESLLEAALARPDVPISELSLLADGERETVLYEWNRTDAPYPDGSCVHDLFVARAAEAPERIAVVCAGRELTYGELEERANALAAHLRGLGVGPESRVGLCLERSAEMVVSVLATWKAGGAYVPLDPAYP
ncbi:MAG: amino acid adenylation domain-containing protein, partial [Gemmatimonadota bacterium]